MHRNNVKLDSKNPKKYQVENQYGVNEGSCRQTPKDQSVKHIRRKPDRRSEKFIHNPDMKKPQVKTNSVDPFCYISQNNIRQLSSRGDRSISQHQTLKHEEHKTARSRIISSTNKNYGINQIKSQRNIRLNHEQLVQAAEQNSKNVKKTADASKNENHELRAMNTILKEEIKSMKSQKESQGRINRKLQDQINSLTLSLRDSNNQVKQYEKKIVQLNHELKMKGEELKMKGEELKMKEEELKMKQQQKVDYIVPNFSKKKHTDDLEKILSDINRGFDEIFTDSKMLSSQIQESFPQASHRIQLQPSIQQSHQQIIYNLRDKIKYMQIEIGMLKKYKYEFQRIEREYEIYKLKMKPLLLTKQRNPERKQKTPNKHELSIISHDGKQEEISFDLSKDETSDGL